MGYDKRKSQASATAYALRKEDRFFEMRLQINEEQKADIREAFHIFDDDGDGVVDLEGLKVTFRALGFDVKKSDLKKWVSEVNPAADWKCDKIPYQEFIEIIERKMCEYDTREDEIKMFRILDHHDRGKITFTDLKRVVNILQLDVNDEEIMEMLEMGKSVSGRNEVNLDEYIIAMRRSPV
ncbi:caltractin-like [Coccinella septempunctata]|uniref:caltractin-like n=1 Tax=Coccinella septempunctata TaxID=41139 RepID=UPI001D064F4E|nr:caltractin-like [Coccinella septempunctata]